MAEVQSLAWQRIEVTNIFIYIFKRVSLSEKKSWLEFALVLVSASCYKNSIERAVFGS